MKDKVSICRLTTTVPGLDSLLGGGLPEFSFNLIAGTPGCGKTTLAHQMMFALASPEKKAVFFTALGEPALKMLRYQQQFDFFDASKINDSILFVSIVEDIVRGNLEKTLARIAAEVKAHNPAFVFVDSFRSITHETKGAQGDTFGVQEFLQNLGTLMSSWQATTFLVGEFSRTELGSSPPVFTIADGILLLTQSMERNSMVRKIEIIKMRGQHHRPGSHTLRIREAGIEIFPRLIMTEPAGLVILENRLSMGVSGLDEMLGGGLPAGYSLLVAGPAGSGKTILATEFLAEGVRQGEAGVIAAFEKSPSQMLNKKLSNLIDSGQIGVLDTRSLDLTIDETLHDLTQLIKKLNAKRVVIDSLAGYELALAPMFREEFRESLYRMVAVLTDMGMTVLMTAEMEDRYNDLRFSPYGSAFLTDAIIVQRYVEMNGRLERVIAVVKIRGSAHSKEMRLFEITDDGMSIGAPVTGYVGAAHRKGEHGRRL